jgi:hypothetical protein
MAFAQVPKNQIDALPVETILEATQPTETKIVGNRIVKTWNPTATGINGQSSNVANPQDGTGAFLETNQFDFTGMVYVTLSLGQKITAVGGTTVVGWTVNAVARAFTVDGEVNYHAFATPDSRNLTGAYAATAFPQVGNLACAALIGIPGYPVYRGAQCSFSTGGIGVGGNVNTGVIGVCRFFLRSATGADPCLNYLTIIASS